MKISIPGSLALEHRELHGELVRIIDGGGKTGAAAKAVSKILHPHFLKEEEYALPPLGLLASVGKEKVSAKMEAVLVMTDKLKKDLPIMLKEHSAVIGGLKRLIAEAKREKRHDAVHFAKKLMLHAKTEEEVLYPAAILIGEHLKLQKKKIGSL